MVAASPRYIRFGPFQVDLYREEVTRDTVPVRIKGKVFQALMALIQKPGEIVTREQLRAQLWPADQDVNYDANVNTTVNKLRQALGDSSSKPAFVETIPRRGYSFIAQPVFCDESATVATRADSQAGSASASDRTTAALKPLLRRLREHWLAFGALILLLAGMLLGAGIMRMWISHGPVQGNPPGAHLALHSPDFRRVNTMPLVRPASMVNA